MDKMAHGNNFMHLNKPYRWTGVFLNIMFAMLVTSAAQADSNEPIERMKALRESALKANAPANAEQQWERGEKYYSRALAAESDGRTDKANDAASDAIQQFDEAELLAIQSTVLAEARTALSAAKANRAAKYAPQTFQHAETLAAQATNLLSSDRYATDQATLLATEAAAAARHADQITAIARGKPKTEELILQWERYLSRVQAAAALTTPLDTDPAVAVKQLETEVSRMRGSEIQLRSDLADSRAFNAALEEEIRLLDDELGGASSERQQLLIQLEAQARSKEQFSQAEALFDKDEAIVFRQSDNIVIRLLGLSFDSGSSKLGPGNEALLAKIGRVIAIYPGSLILIEGHTDSQGSDRNNKRLSEQRAQSVANQLVSDMYISAMRLNAVGYGSDRPIANNETKLGREQNRRIDLLITPKTNAAL